MISVSKIVGVISCSFVLCLSLSSASQAVETARLAPCAERDSGQPDFVKCDDETQEGVHTITGEILHINGPNLLVKLVDGEEAIYHIDLSTQISGRIGPGSYIRAKVYEVEDKRYALSVDQTE